MNVALAFVVGAILGASIAYWYLQNTMQAQLTAQRKQLDQNHRLMGEMEQSHETRMQDVVTSIQKKHEQELENQRQPLETQIQDLQQKHQDELNDLAQDHWNTLESFQTERYLETSHLKREHSEEVTALHSDIIHLKQQFQYNMQALQQQFQEQLDHETESARTEFQMVVDQFINDQQAELSQLQQRHQQEMAELKSQSNTSSPLQDEEKSTEVTETSRQVSEPRSIVTSPPSHDVFPHEPDSSPDPFLMTIQMLGQSKRVAAIRQLAQQVKRAEPEGKVAIATALGQIAKANPQSPTLQKAIPPLSQLSQDIKPAVRQAAIEALGNIPSAKVIPLVKRALRDPDAKVVRVANQAMEKLKPFRKRNQSLQKQSSYFS